MKLAQQSYWEFAGHLIHLREELHLVLQLLVFLPQPLLGGPQLTQLSVQALAHLWGSKGERLFPHSFFTAVKKSIFSTVRKKL